MDSLVCVRHVIYAFFHGLFLFDPNDPLGCAIPIDFINEEVGS